MNDAERTFQTILRQLIETAAEDNVPGFDELLDATVDTFENHGVMTRNAGLVVHLGDGSEMQLTVVQSERAREEVTSDS